MKTNEIISNMIDEKDGFSFGEAIVVKKANLDTIVPILRNKKKDREYFILAEARDIEINDTGKINNVYVKNNEDKPLLVTKGEIFQGKTQERVAIHSYIIEPGKGCNIEVHCVHASKGIVGNAGMTYGGKAPSYVDYSNQSNTWRSITTNNSGDVFYQNANMTLGVGDDVVRSGYSSVVDRTPLNDPNVILTHQAMFLNTNIGASIGGTTKGADDLVSQLKAKKQKLDNVLKMIPRQENQVGVIFIDDKKLRALELYDLESAWAFVQEDTISKEGSDFIEEPEVDLFDFVPERLKAFLNKKLTGFEQRIIWNKERYTVLELKNKEMIGEMSLMDGELIHLTLVRV